jgi:hypothetical protein
MRTVFFILAVSAGLMAAAVTTAQDPAPKLSQSDINALQREISSQERSLRKFSSLIRKLESTERESSNTGRRRALNDLQNAMGEVIIVAERKLGEDYVITQHREEVEEVSTSNVGSGSGVRTRKRVYQVPESENSPPVAYYHLVRQQAIFVSCKTSLEPAAAKQGSSYAQYLGLVKEFAGLMSRDIDALRAQLPPEPAAEEPQAVDG